MTDLTKAPVTPNITQNGGVFGGFFRMRNAIEAAFILGFFVWLLGIKIFPLFMSGKIALFVCCLIGFPLAGLALFGIRSLSLSEFIMDKISYYTTRCYVTLRMPLPEKSENVVEKALIVGDEDFLDEDEDIYDEED